MSPGENRGTGSLEITLRKHTFRLLPGRALFWEDTHTLVIADLHLGKVRHFRSSGMAVSREAGEENFLRLDRLVEEWNPRRVLFLGDLFHSRHNADWEKLGIWMESRSGRTRFQLIRGNHDILKAEHYSSSPLEILPEPHCEGEFLFTHHPRETPAEKPGPPPVPSGRFILAGHLHPGVTLRGPARQYRKVPCFFLQGDRQLVLPAFGSFTGTSRVKPTPADRVFVVAGDKVREALP